MIFNPAIIQEAGGGSTKFLIDDSGAGPFSNLPDEAAPGEFLTYTNRDSYEVGLVVTTESGKMVPVLHSGRD